jgi:uncharacterized membrane protein YeaQ/YmgE (transglycosylase-associated protein family)
MSFLIWIVVGVIAGWAAGKIMKGSGYGVLGDLVLGLLGGLVGGWLLGVLGLYSGGGLIPSIITAIIGAVVLVAIVRMIKKA